MKSTCFADRTNPRSARAVARTFAGIAIAAFAAFGAANAQEQTLTIAQGSSSFHGMITHLADEGGFFAAEGLRADIVDLGTGPRIAAAVIGGGAHIAAVGLNQAVRAVSEGGDIVAVGRLFDIISLPVVVSNDAIESAGITEDMSLDERIVRLRGLTIGATTPGSTTNALMRALAQNRGLDPDNDITIQAISGGGNLFAAFENGVIDGFVFGSPWPELAITRDLGRPLFDPFTDDVPEIEGVLYQVLTTSRRTLAEEPELIERALRAYSNAMAFAHENPEEAARLLRNVFPDVEQASYDLAVLKYIEGVPTELTITPEQYAATLAFMEVTEPEPVGDVPYESVIDTTVSAAIDGAVD